MYVASPCPHPYGHVDNRNSLGSRHKAHIHAHKHTHTHTHTQIHQYRSTSAESDHTPKKSDNIAFTLCGRWTEMYGRLTQTAQQNNLPPQSHIRTHQLSGGSDQSFAVLSVHSCTQNQQQPDLILE